MHFTSQLRRKSCFPPNRSIPISLNLFIPAAIPARSHPSRPSHRYNSRSRLRRPNCSIPIDSIVALPHPRPRPRKAFSRNLPTPGVAARSARLCTAFDTSSSGSFWSGSWYSRRKLPSTESTSSIELIRTSRCPIFHRGGHRYCR